MRNTLLAPELRELLAEGRREDLVQVLQDLHPNDAAAILSGLEPDEVVEIMSLLPIELERDVFIYLEPDAQQQIVIGSGRGRVKELLTSMPSDVRAEFLDGLDEATRSQLTPLLSRAAHEDLLRRARFEDDQVGSILSTEYCVLDEKLTTVRAIEQLRRQAPTRETIYYSYVLDRASRLKGFVSLRDLIVAPDEATVGEIMRTEMIRVLPDTDQEEAAHLIKEYDLLALPVVDEEDRLVGIVTFDDAEDVVEEEVTEDVELMAGITGETDAEGYMDEPVLSHIRRRAPIISFLAIFFYVTASVIGSFEEELKAGNRALYGLLPMVMATGGMVGTQASSLIIRALTTGHVQPRGLLRVLWKEFRVSLGMAVILSLIVAAEAYLIGTGDARFGEQALHTSGVLALAMATHVTSAALLGAMVPVAARALRRDPAMVSTPAVTAVADLSGATIYLVMVATFLDL